MFLDVTAKKNELLCYYCSGCSAIKTVLQTDTEIVTSWLNG